jgi:hypothetical protein
MTRQRVEHNKRGMHWKVETITPAKAQRWLDTRNTHNRTLSEAEAQRFARDMLAGKWALTPQGISFNAEGIILDGQTRLRAIVIAGKPVQMMVFDNVPTAAQPYMDKGRPRGTADVLTLTGTLGRVSRTEIATLRNMIGCGVSESKCTDSEVAALLSKHREAIRFALDNLKHKINGISNGVTRGVVARAWYSADHEKLRHFCDVLTTGMYSSAADSPIRLLWSWLLAGGTNGQARTSVAREKYGKTERALYAYLKGEKISKLCAVEKELFPIPE